MMRSVNEMETDVRTWWEKFKDNLHRVWAYATAWYTTIMAGVWAWWSSLDKVEKLDLIGAYISANKASVLLGVVTVGGFLVAKGWPQPVLAAKVEAAKVDATDTVPSGH